jgi:hypothetical protein
MTRFDGAVIKEPGVTFAVAVVRRPVLDSLSERDEAQAEFAAVFGGLPTVLMAQDANGVPRYYGRSDLVRFLANVPMEAISWSAYSVN